MLLTTLVLLDWPQGYILSYFLKFFRVVSLSRICWISSDLYIPPCVRKIFQFMVFTFSGNALNLCIFTHVPSPPLKTPGKIFWKSVSPKTKEEEKTLSKFKQKTWSWLGTLVYLYLVWFVIFLNVMTLHFCEKMWGESTKFSKKGVLDRTSNFRKGAAILQKKWTKIWNI